MIVKIIKDCFIEGRKYVDGMYLVLQDHIPFNERFMSADIGECGVCVSHCADDLERIGFVEDELSGLLPQDQAVS